MKFNQDLIQATLIKRYKRFFVDAKFEDGTIITAHCANTGSMTTCFEAGRTAYFSIHNDPKRKLKYSLEIIQAPKTLIGVNTHQANKLALEAINNKIISELKNYQNIIPEYKIGNSRLDLMLSNSSVPECFVEIKSVTLLGENQIALFPDAITTRGQKHLKELIELKKQGYHTVMLFIIQREDVDKFALADKIDPEYSRLLYEAEKFGVEILVYRCCLSTKQIIINKKIKHLR